MTFSCSCPEPAGGSEFHCPALGRTMTRRRWELCSCSGPRAVPSLCEQYRSRWLAEKAGRPACKPSGPAPAGPGPARLVANAARAAARSAARALRGLPVLAPAEVAAARLGACRSNACGLFDAGGDRCLHKACGCKLSRRRALLGLGGPPGKTEVAGEACPAGLWGAWDGPEPVAPKSPAP